MSRLVTLVVSLMLVALLCGLAVEQPSMRASPHHHEINMDSISQEGVQPEFLLQQTLDELPPLPVFIELLRISLEPGSTVPGHTHSGPEIGWIETGTLTVAVEDDATVLRRGETGVTPAVDEEFELRAGDQILYPAGTAHEFWNAGQVPVTILTVAILPAGSQRPPAVEWSGATPVPDDLTGVRTRLLGSGFMNIFPEGPAEISVDRLALGPGVSIPAFPGPVMLAVELGNYGFTLVGGDVQVTRAPTLVPQLYATPDVTVFVRAGDSVFFPRGLSEVERTNQDGTLVVLALSVLPTETTGPVPTRGDIVEGAQVIVNQAGVRLRAGPSTDADIVATLEEGHVLVVTGPAEIGDDLIWWQVRDAEDEELVGYVSEDLIQPQE